MAPEDLIFIYLCFIIFFIGGLILLRDIYRWTEDKNFIHNWINKLFKLNNENSLISFFFRKMSIFEEVLQEMFSTVLGVIGLVFFFILDIIIIIYQPEFFFEKILPLITFICISAFWEEYKRECLTDAERGQIVFFEFFLLIFFLLIAFYFVRI